jgi:hypothetical protein
MALEVPISEKHLEIRYTGVYDIGSVYNAIRNWLDMRRYDYMETLNKDKVSTVFGNEVEWKMRPEQKVDGFIKYHIEVDTHFYDVKEFEAVVDGKKTKLTDGKFWIKISGSVEFDWQEKFRTPLANQLLKFLVLTLFKRYYRYKYIYKLNEDMYDLQTEIKKDLKMEIASNAYYTT